MKTLSEMLMWVAGKALKALFWIERELFFWTGIKLPFLNAVWKRQGNRLQKKLDKEHNTHFAQLAAR